MRIYVFASVIINQTNLNCSSKSNNLIRVHRKVWFFSSQLLHQHLHCWDPCGAPHQDHFLHITETQLCILQCFLHRRFTSALGTYTVRMLHFDRKKVVPQLGLSQMKKQINFSQLLKNRNIWTEQLSSTWNLKDFFFRLTTSHPPISETQNWHIEENKQNLQKVITIRKGI